MSACSADVYVDIIFLCKHIYTFNAVGIYLYYIFYCIQWMLFQGKCQCTCNRIIAEGFLVILFFSSQNQSKAIGRWLGMVKANRNNYFVCCMLKGSGASNYIKIEKPRSPTVHCIASINRLCECCCCKTLYYFICMDADDASLYIGFWKTFPWSLKIDNSVLCTIF